MIRNSIYLVIILFVPIEMHSIQVEALLKLISYLRFINLKSNNPHKNKIISSNTEGEVFVSKF